MADYDIRLEQAANKAEIASEQLHDFVNGPDTGTISTESGPLPTIAKFIKDEKAIVEAQVADAADDVAQAVVDAQTAQTAAESARDAAQLSAGVYVNTAAGLAATSSGEYFSVPSSDSNEYLILYKNNAGSAVEQKRYPSSTAVQAIEQAIRAEMEQPNVLTEDQLLFNTLPLSINSTIMSVQSADGRKALKASSAAGIGEARITWRVPVSSFPSGRVSGQVTIVSANAGTAGSVRIIQRSAALASLVTNTMRSGFSGAATNPIVCAVAGVSINPSAAFIDLDISLINSGGDREFVCQSPMLVDGSCSSFRNPAPPAVPVDATSGVSEARLLTEVATDVTQQTHDLPLSITTFVPSGSISVASGVEYQDKAYSLSFTTVMSASLIAAAKLSSDPLVAGEVVRLSAVLQSSAVTPSLGLGFGDGSKVVGFALRTTAQLLTLTLPDNTSGAATGPTALTYAVGDRLVIDARLAGGSPGNYSVEYYVEYESGQRFGPYTISGITTLDGIWFMDRSNAVWSDVRLTRHKAPRYISEFVAGDSETPGIVYVSPSGNDLNTGSKASPFATFNKAVDAIGGNGIVEIAGGEYRQSLSMNNVAGHVWFRAEKQKRVIILGSNQLSLTKTGGYTQVYQASLATKPTGMGGGRGAPMIFEWGTASKLIDEADRHDLHRGETHRLPYTEMLEAASLAELDTVGGRGKWWWDAGVIYLAATDGSDATLKRYEVRARTCVTGTGGGSVKFTRVDAFFSSLNGMYFRDMHSVEREECRAFGNYQNGFSDDANIVKSYRDEAAGNGNDGFNGTTGTYAGTGNREAMYCGVYVDPYGHDNYDDGISYHIRGENSVQGGLFEFNSKAGVVHVTGAQCANYNTISRYNGNGFYAATPAPDGRVTSVLRAHCCIAYGNDYNYRAADAVVLAFDCVADDEVLWGYHQAGTGKIEARNCKHSGDPAKARTGNVVVITDSALS